MQTSVLNEMPIRFERFRKPDDYLTTMADCSSQIIAVCLFSATSYLLFESGIPNGIQLIHKICSSTNRTCSLKGGISANVKPVKLLRRKTALRMLHDEERTYVKWTVSKRNYNFHIY
jgi:hypothetical protein